MGTHDPKDIDEEVNSSWKLVSHLVSIFFKLRMLNTEIATECDRALLKCTCTLFYQFVHSTVSWHFRCVKV